MTLRSRTVDVVFGVLEGIASLHSFVTRMRRRATRDTDPIPLTRPAERKPAPITERLPRPPRVPRDLS